MRRSCLYLMLLAGIPVPLCAQASAPAQGGAIDTTWRATAATAIPITRRLAGNPSEAGPFRYYYQAPAGASLSAHRHSADMRITVRSGIKFILMGDLESARVQRFEAGSTFVIPAGTWHVEWWESDTLEEIDGVGPMRSDRASPATPRTP
jgi:hypothetical protein